jgi:hypothetical protein
MRAKEIVFTPYESALWRLIRNLLPQVPAILVYISGQHPEWAAELALLGVIINALFKYLRDKGMVSYKIPL